MKAHKLLCILLALLMGTTSQAQQNKAELEDYCQKALDCYRQEKYTEAFDWYMKAAQQGYAKAQYYVGMKYASGEGVEQNDKEALRWYEKSARRGYADAQAALHMMYMIGIGTGKWPERADYWLKKYEANPNK